MNWDKDRNGSPLSTPLPLGSKGRGSQSFQRSASGHFINPGVGLGGTMIGRFMTEMFKNDIGLGKISVSLVDLISAFTGVFVLLSVLRRVLKALEEIFK